ncbi:unnamed protein product, partial [Amoebophrya sp. A120]
VTSNVANQLGRSTSCSYTNGKSSSLWNFPALPGGGPLSHPRTPSEQITYDQHLLQTEQESPMSSLKNYQQKLTTSTQHINYLQAGTRTATSSRASSITAHHQARNYGQHGQRGCAGIKGGGAMLVDPSDGDAGSSTYRAMIEASGTSPDLLVQRPHHHDESRQRRDNYYVGDHSDDERGTEERLLVRGTTHQHNADGSGLSSGMLSDNLSTSEDDLPPAIHQKPARGGTSTTTSKRKNGSRVLKTKQQLSTARSTSLARTWSSSKNAASTSHAQSATTSKNPSVRGTENAGAEAADEGPRNDESSGHVVAPGCSRDFKFFARKPRDLGAA